MSELLLHPKVRTYADKLRQAGVYILHGPKGIGKTVFAMSALVDYRPVKIVPDEKGIIGVKTVKELTSKLRYRATEVPAVIVLDDAHAMTMSAQNAFLKTLEEMPADMRVVLVTHHLHGLLPTVRSRCQALFMPAPTVDQFNEWLSNHRKNQSFADLKKYHFSPTPAAVLEETTVNGEILNKIPSLCGEDLYSRMVAAKQLSSSLPYILPYILSYVRFQLRSDPQSRLWQGYLNASISSLRLSESRVSDRTVLDIIAMVGSRRG